WQLRHELILGGNLVMHESVATKAFQLRRRRRTPLPQHNEGLHHLAAHGVGNADYSHLRHRWMRRDDFFDLAWPHLKPARLATVFLAIDDEDVTIFVHVAEIPRVE